MKINFFATLVKGFLFAQLILLHLFTQFIHEHIKKVPYLLLLNRFDWATPIYFCGGITPK